MKEDLQRTVQSEDHLDIDILQAREKFVRIHYTYTIGKAKNMCSPPDPAVQKQNF